VQVQANLAPVSSLRGQPGLPRVALDRVACRLERKAWPGVLWRSAPAHEVRGGGAQGGLGPDRHHRGADRGSGL